MKLSFSILFIFLFQFAFCQYETLESVGDVPKDFTTPSYIKYEKEIEKVSRKKTKKRRTRKNQKEFYLESNFGIDDLLQSGRVMFNDPVSEYVTDVANVLLENEPRLKKKLRFYAVRTPSVNAFATNQGIVLVNMGLMAQLENEAQLAFILAHEIAHFKEKHALQFYLESKEIDRQNSRGFLRRKKLDTKLAKNQFSKEQESEADELGLETFLKSNYRLEDVQGAFDVLQFSYLPFDEAEFNKSFFEDDYLLFPPKYQLDTIVAINTDMETDDTESTHPSLPKRRKAADEIMASTSKEGRKKYIVSESRFKDLQKRARYELLEYNLRNYEFYEAVYHSFLLQKEYPQDLYLKKITAKALYGMTKFRNARQFSDYELDHEKIEGQLGSSVFFLNKLSRWELNAFALRYAYLLKDDFKNEPVFQAMIEDICQDMVNNHSKKLKEFKEGKHADFKYEPKEEQSTDEENSEKENSKYDKIKKQKEETARSKYIYYAFGDMLGDEDFKSMMEKCKKNKKRDEDEDFNSPPSFYSKGDFALGEKKVLVINPFYLKLKKGFKEPRLIKTEKSQTQFNNIITSNAKSLNLKVKMLDVNNLSKKDAETFNDLVTVQEWFSHQMDMEDDLDMIAFNQEKIDALAEKYGVDTFVWLGLVSGKVPKNAFEIYGKLLFNQFSWLHGIITPKGESIIFSIVLDAESGRTRMATFDLFKFPDHQDILKQRVYDILSQIEKKPKR